MHCNSPTIRVLRNEEEVTEERAEGVASLVTKDSIVAIAAEGDTVHSYYMMKVTSEGAVILDKEYTDSYGNVFPPEATVLKGGFFECTNFIDRLYKLFRKAAAAHATCTRYISPGLEERKKGRGKTYCNRVPLEQH